MSSEPVNALSTANLPEPLKRLPVPVASDDSTGCGEQLPTRATSRNPAKFNLDVERDRPRERLFKSGASALRDSELLALCLGNGTAGRSAIEISRNLLFRFGSLGRILRARPDQLLAEQGVGFARVAALKAVLALAERTLFEEIEAGPVIQGADTVKKLLSLRLDGQERELFAALFLDSRHRLIAYEVLFSGTIDSASVYPREIIRECLIRNAAAIVLAHNHPSGLAEPSVADIALTERLKPLLSEMGVRLLDHVIVGRAQVVSMAERGLV
jgi:DNA repair protein RadC